jgi:hypothetical protein
MGPDHPPPGSVLDELVPVIKEAANAVVDLYLANLPASAEPFEDFADMSQALGNGAVAKTLTAGEVEAVVAVVLAERPMTWWSRNWRWRLLGRKRDEKLNRAYLLGIIGGALAMQQRLAQDPAASARIANEAQAGIERPGDLCQADAALVMNRKDYVTEDEYQGNMMVYNTGFDLGQVALMVRRSEMIALL